MSHLPHRTRLIPPPPSYRRSTPLVSPLAGRMRNLGCQRAYDETRSVSLKASSTLGNFPVAPRVPTDNLCLMTS